MIELDGASQSGSGTVVRTGLALSALTRQPVRISAIRAKRPNPGLRHQHLAVLEALVQMTGGRSIGGSPGSRTLEFYPGSAITGGEYEWKIGSAGSATLMASTVILVAAFSDRPSQLVIEGGVFQDHAPSGFHFEHCLLPLLRQMGVEIDYCMARPGYVPRGGGLLEIRVSPVSGCLKPVVRTEMKEKRCWGIALSSHLERANVSQRMAEACAEVLARKGLQPVFRVLEDHTAPQQGAGLTVFCEDDHGCIVGADMAGAPGRRSEWIGDRVGKRLWQDLKTGATVDRFMADAVIFPAALARGTSAFEVPSWSDHCRTAAWLVQKFLGASVTLSGQRLTVKGVAFKRNGQRASAG